MKKMICFVVFLGVMFCHTEASLAKADACKTKWKEKAGAVCLKRRPCEPVNNLLLKAARECRKEGHLKYVPITRLSFMDIFFQAMRLDRELGRDIAALSDKERYALETKVMADKGAGIFIGKNAMDPLTRDELAALLKPITIEGRLGYSNGLADQIFELANDGLVIYDAKVYVDRGSGPEAWERKRNFDKSLPGDRHYVIKLDSRGDVRVVFGGGKKGKIPLAGSKISSSYKIFGKEEQFVTTCETAVLLSNPEILRSLRNEYNPSRMLTRANFAELLIKTMHMEKELPSNSYKLGTKELYILESKLLSKKGIDIFTYRDPKGLLTREELAKVLYNSPVEEIVGTSNGKANQAFNLNNAGFMIYDLHVYVDEGAGFVEWNKNDNFAESTMRTNGYLLKSDSGNYASIYFGDGNRGRIPAANSPVKALYRLYAPVTMLTEDDIVCVLGKMKPVAETYIPPSPHFDYPDPKDGFEDPASHF